jgi:hypothetical protein
MNAIMLNVEAPNRTNWTNMNFNYLGEMKMIDD